VNALVRLWYRWQVVCSLFGPRWNMIDWDRQDAKSLATFLETSSGKKLVVTMRNAALEAAVRSCHAEVNNLEIAAGFAKGWQAAFALLCNLSALRPPQTPEPYRGVLRPEERNGAAASQYYSVPEQDEEEIL
jgi:hypothetical protein